MITKTVVTESRRRAEKIVKEHSANDNSDNISIKSMKSDSCFSARLPKLDLPTFNGNVTEWYPIWDQFIVIIDDSELPKVTKFTYLKSVLQGEAKESIRGLALTEVNYLAAVNILKERYGRKERIIASHIDALLTIEVPEVSTSMCQIGEMWKLVDEIQGHVRALENLGISGET